MCLVSIQRPAWGDIIDIAVSFVVWDLPHLRAHNRKGLKEIPTPPKKHAQAMQLHKCCPLLKWHDRCSPPALSDGK